MSEALATKSKEHSINQGNKGYGKGLPPFGMKDKFGYMLGDMANNMFFSFVGGYLMLFYTDIVGISAAAVGTLLVVARVWDAINDPMIGTFIDTRPVKKGGKFKPYLLYFAVPVTLAGVLSFTTISGAGYTTKLIYAYVTYILFGMMYTCINIPYGSLASVMTNDPVERTSLSTWRSIGSMASNIIIIALAPALIFKNGVPTQGGFLTTAVIFGIVAVGCYVLSGKLTTERIIHQQQNKEKIKMKTVLKGLSKNRALIGLMVASLSQLAAMMLAQSVSPYVFKEYFKAPHLTGIVGGLSMVIMFLILPVLSPLVKRFGKKELVSAGLALAAVSYTATFILPITNPYVFIAMQGVASLGMSFINLLLWAIVSDAIDYHEYITGERSEGIVYASYSLVRKIGQALAGGLGGIALTVIGYVSSAPEQTAEVALGLKNISTLAPAISATISVIAMMFICNLSKERLVTLNKDLEEMRAKKA